MKSAKLIQWSKSSDLNRRTFSLATSRWSSPSPTSLQISSGVPLPDSQKHRSKLNVFTSSTAQWTTLAHTNDRRIPAEVLADPSILLLLDLSITRPVCLHLKQTVATTAIFNCVVDYARPVWRPNLKLGLNLTCWVLRRQDLAESVIGRLADQIRSASMPERY